MSFLDLTVGYNRHRAGLPALSIIDSQSVKSAEKGGLASTATASMPAS